MKRNAEAKRRIRAGTQKAMRARAERLRCPKCSRKSAMVRLPGTGGLSVCRYCKHESTPETRAALKGGTT